MELRNGGDTCKERRLSGKNDARLHDATRRHGVWIALGITGVLIAPHLGVPTLVYPLFGFALCTAMLAMQRRRWSDVGFRWRGCRPTPLLVGGTLGVFYALANDVVIGPLLFRLIGTYPDFSDFDFVRAHVSGYLIALALSWIVGGLYEELVFRGFLYDALLRYLPVRHARTPIAVTATAVAFAAYHWQLGAFGIANAFVFAWFVAAVRYRWPDNLWYAISFHACADMTAFTLMRLGYL